MKIRILSPAQDEIHSIIRYYDDQAVGLGLDFIEELDEAWDLIREHPEIGARYHGEIRCLFLRRFLFAVLYSIEPNETVVHAVAHQRRRPGYWKERG